MPVVRIRARGFSMPYDRVVGDYVKDLSPGDVTRAIITVGEPSAPTRGRWGPRERRFVRAKALLLGANLDFSKSSLRLTAEFSDLDGSEKGVVAYFAGMAFAKIAAKSLLGVEWLQYVDKLIGNRRVRLASGLKRADLAGLDGAGRWHVFEAKGRSAKSASKTNWKDWKAQARNVVSVDGRTPATQCASLALCRRAPILVEVRDPDDSEREPECWQFTRAEFLQAYYVPIMSYLEAYGGEETEWFGVPVVRATIPMAEGGIVVGLSKAIAEDPRSALRSGYEAARRLQIATADYPGDVSFGADGIILEQFTE